MPHPQKNPPNRWKYCPTCNKVTKFKFNRATGHSHCNDCGQSPYVPAMSEDDERKLRKSTRHAWKTFDKKEWERPDHTVKRTKPRWLIAEEKKGVQGMKECEYCKKEIPHDKYRCDVCHYAYTHGFENGEASARREVGKVLRECLDAEKGGA